MSDYIVRATAANDAIRAFAITSKDMVEEARSRHNTSPIVTAALGRMLSAGSMMGVMLKGEDDLVFTNPDGTHLSNSNVYRHFKRIMKQMSLNEVRFHDLRHTYAVLALQNGIVIKTVSASLGHYSVAFTMDKYGHVSNTMRKMASEKIGYYIEGLGLTPIQARRMGQIRYKAY